MAEAIRSMGVDELLLLFLAGKCHWFRGESVLVQNKSSLSYEIEVFPVRGRWEVRNTATQKRISYDVATRVWSEESGSKTLRPSFPRFPVHQAAKLLFPFELPIWGRSEDDYSPVSAERSGAEAILLLRHRRVPEMLASLRVDLGAGHAVQFVTPDHEIRISRDTGGST